MWNLVLSHMAMQQLQNSPNAKEFTPRGTLVSWMPQGQPNPAELVLGYSPFDHPSHHSLLLLEGSITYSHCCSLLDSLDQEGNFPCNVLLTLVTLPKPLRRAQDWLHLYMFNHVIASHCQDGTMRIQSGLNQILWYGFWWYLAQAGVKWFCLAVVWDQSVCGPLMLILVIQLVPSSIHKPPIHVSNFVNHFPKGIHRVLVWLKFKLQVSPHCQRSCSWLMAGMIVANDTDCFPQFLSNSRSHFQ